MTYEKISNISLLFRKRQENNKDVLVISTGEKGDGKSNYIMQQARDYILKFGLVCSDCGYEFIYTGRCLKPSRSGLLDMSAIRTQDCPKCQSSNTKRSTSFDFNTWMGYDAEEVEAKIHSLPKFAPLLSDELARYALSMNWNSGESKNMKKLLMQCRTKNLVLMGNLPDFVNLDKTYRNMADYWVRILQRDNNSALALFLKRSKGEHADKFHIKQFQELLGDYFEDTSMLEVERIADAMIRKHPCVEDSFKIPPLPKDLYADYERYRDSKVFAKEEKDLILDERIISKIFVYNLLENWETFSKAIKEGRYERPTLKMLEDYLARNPVTGHILVRYTTIRNWQKEIEGIVRVSGVKNKESITENITKSI